MKYLPVGLLMVLMSGCFLNHTGWLAPETRSLRGTITKVEERAEYEAPCPIIQNVIHPGMCDSPPVCCSYRISILTTEGETRYFMAFWGKYAEGLREGNTATFFLHRDPVYLLPCTLFGCNYDTDYVLESDNDIR